MKYELLKLEDNDTCTECIPVLITKLAKAQKKASMLLLDMHDVSLINSGGIGVLIRTHKDLQLAGGGIVLANVTETLRGILEHSGICEIVKVYDRLADARKSLDRKE
ncbi:MAG: STAS domain-containing protein [Fibrobacterota bacterium]